MTKLSDYYEIQWRWPHKGKLLPWRHAEFDIPETFRDAVSAVLECSDEDTRADRVRVLHHRRDGTRADCTVLVLQGAAAWHERNDCPVPWWLRDYASEDAREAYDLEMFRAMQDRERQEDAA